MKKRFLGVVTGLVLGMALLTGCGSAGTGASYDSFATTESAVESKAIYDYNAMAPEEAAYDEGSGQSSEQVYDSSRKLITTMSINAETENLDQVLGSIESKVKELGGYIEASNIYNGSYYGGRSISRDASLTLRIPAQRLDEFIDTVAGSTNITNKSTNVEDVTLNYVDTQSRKNALVAEEKRLIEIMEAAETVEDLITVESRLADVRYELESIESRLRSYDNQIDYSTVYLNIDEVTRYTETKEKGAFERMADGFLESVQDVLDAIVEFFIWFVIHIPQIIIVLIVIVVLILVIRAIDKAGKKKHLQKMQMMQQGAFSGQVVQAPNTQGQFVQSQAPQGTVQNNQQNGPDAPKQ